jgi:hypothetical protein
MHQARAKAGIGLVIAALALAGCNARAVADASAPGPKTSPESVQESVPDVSGMVLDAAAKRLDSVKLAHVVRYAPEVLVGQGSIILSVPKAGATLASGDVVVLVVAGAPDGSLGEGTPGARALADLAEARQDVFVGAGRDGDGATVVAFNPGADIDAWRDRLAAAARGEKYAIRRCEHSRNELTSVKASLLPADLLPRAPRIHFASALRPAACSVWVSGAFTPDEAVALRAAYGTAITVEATP